METTLDEPKIFDKAWRSTMQDMEIALLKQEVRGLKAMLNQYKRDYKKLLEEKI